MEAIDEACYRWWGLGKYIINNVVLGHGVWFQKSMRWLRNLSLRSSDSTLRVRVSHGLFTAVISWPLILLPEFLDLSFGTPKIERLTTPSAASSLTII